MPDFPQELLGKHVMLYVESLTTADLFEKKCIFAESLSHTSDKQYDEYETRDCANPDAPATKRKVLKSITDSFAGTGHIKSPEALEEMDDWHYGDAKRKVELRVHQALATGLIGALVVTYKGSARLAIGSRDLNPGGPIVASATISFDEQITRVYA